MAGRQEADKRAGGTKDVACDHKQQSLFPSGQHENYEPHLITRQSMIENNLNGARCLHLSLHFISNVVPNIKYYFYY